MKYLFLAFIGGLLFSLEAIIMKILLDEMELVEIIFKPIVILPATLGIAGFYMLQKSLEKEKGSHVSLVISSITTVFPILGGLFLGETVNSVEAIGIILIVISIFTILFKNQ